MNSPNSRDDSTALRYVPALDGIRAIAIVGVLVFHVSPQPLSGGFTGVDVFFVLSGFLITSILLRDLGRDRFSLSEFYLRRIQRLLPNITVTVLAVLALWHVWMLPSAARQAGAHGLWSLFNLSNFYVWKFLGGYWGDAAEAAPFTHMWSLGVEEQFYLLFPVSLALLVRSQPQRTFAWLSAATLVSFAACVVGTNSFASATFYLLPTRLWELLLGALVAVHRTRTLAAARLSPRTREALGGLGLAAIGVGYVLIDEGRGFPGVLALMPTLGTVLLLLAVVDEGTHIGRWLSHPLLVRTGLLSYSLYLWHWPLIIFGRSQAELNGFSGLLGAGVGALASIVVAVGVFFAVERPLRRRGPGRRRRLATIAAGVLLAAVVSGVLAARSATIDPDDRFAPATFSGKLFDTGRTANVDPASAARYADVMFARPPDRDADSWRTGGIVHRYGGGDPQVVVLGSSQALMYARLIDDLCREQGLSVAFLTVDEGAPVFFNTGVSANFPTQSIAREFDAARRHWLRTWRPEAIVVVDRWDQRARRGFGSRLREFLAEVSPLAGRVLFVAQIPVIAHAEHVNLRELALWRANADGMLPRLEADKEDEARRKVAAVAEAETKTFPKLRVLRADLPFYRDDGSVRYAEGRDFYYADDDHLTDEGADVVRTLFAKAIAEAHRAAAPGSKPVGVSR